MSPIVVAAFYKFVPLQDLEGLQSSLDALCMAEGLRGIILIASEGINGTVAGTREGIDALLGHLRRVPAFADLLHKESTCDRMPFHRMKVRLKKEIVTLGVPEVSPRERVGTYVPPARWNDLLADPEVLLVDTRNVYETRLGTFEGAVDPGIQNFSDFPAWVRQNLDPTRHRKVAMFCTGGIRCEKATSFMLQEGFESVFHLEGGILKYLEEVPKETSRWRGDCFVFDQRVALDHSLSPGDHTLCFGCQNPITPADRQSPLFEAGVCCPYCHAQVSAETRAGRRERARQMELARARGAAHIGDDV